MITKEAMVKEIAGCCISNASAEYAAEQIMALLLQSQPETEKLITPAEWKMLSPETRHRINMYVLNVQRNVQSKAL